MLDASTHARMRFCRCYYFLLFFPITTHVLVSFVTLLLTLHTLSTILLSVLSLEKKKIV